MFVKLGLYIKLNFVFSYCYSTTRRTLPVNWFCTSIHSVILSFSHSFIHLSIHSSIHLFIHSPRQETSAIAASWRRVVTSEVGCVVTAGRVGGVSCQWVRPRVVRGPEVILYLHGGGFVLGSPDDDLSMTARLAHGTGRRVRVPQSEQRLLL